MKNIVKKRIRFALFPVVLVMVILGCSGCLVMDQSKTASSSPSLSPTPTPTFDEPEQLLPGNGAMLQLQQAVDGVTTVPLKIVTSVDRFATLKFKDRNGNTVIEWLLYPNTTVNTHVPIGVYKALGAAGLKWYGDKYLFGPETQYMKVEHSEDSDTFSFEEGWEYTFYLKGVPDGDLRQVLISKAEYD